MPKSVMPWGAKNRKVSKEKEWKNLAVFTKTLRLKRFCFSAKRLSNIVKTVALTSAPENVGENHDISFEAPFTLRLPGHIDMSFFRYFLFVISGFCLLFGWMLLIADSLSSLWKCFFSARIHCSVYIINSLLAANWRNCMCRWAPYLFDCKLRLINFFHHFVPLTIKSGLHFLFFCFVERYGWRSVFPWLRFVDQILLSHSILLVITCTSVTEGIMINRR